MFAYVSGCKYLCTDVSVCAHGHGCEEREGDTANRPNLTVAKSGLKYQGIYCILLKIFCKFEITSK